MGDPVALNVQHLTKTYGTGPNALTVLDDVSFALATGSTCAVVGPSGSGKTTLLGLCAGLDRASSGSVALDGVDLDGLDEDQRAHLRSEKVGFVFQTFQLIPTLSALENAMVPLELRREPNVRERAIDLLDRVGLGDRLHHYPAQLSGASSSAWRSRGPLSTAPRSSSPTSLPATSTTAPAAKCGTCSLASTRNPVPP